ncbi:exodeoxyribonuclease VII small subunit [Nocardiopsis xinjiangensis]|uniref:exodeoxyribonuclease VII small subunit n=1 Tax=Nocardiopsis xinjiangensis TaxID=124285 RepID=UPI000346CE46|nr:exodeoxyribonuclease VII small subunit [Nocardiopsis xinjiangensis]
MSESAETGSDTAAEPEMSYEESREELNDVVRRLESGGLSLKDSLALWERGEELARVCEQWLEGARAKLAAAMDERAENRSGAGGEDAGTPF